MRALNEGAGFDPEETCATPLVAGKGSRLFLIKADRFTEIKFLC
jgi:hypothetical protein